MVVVFSLFARFEPDCGSPLGHCSIIMLTYMSTCAREHEHGLFCLIVFSLRQNMPNTWPP